MLKKIHTFIVCRTNCLCECLIFFFGLRMIVNGQVPEAQLV